LTFGIWRSNLNIISCLHLVSCVLYLMHIGIDARMYGPYHRGIGRYVQCLIEGLAKIDDGHRYTLFMGSNAAASFVPPSGKFKAVKADVPWYSLREHWVMPRLVKRSKVDIMHWPHINVPYFCPVPYAVTVHDLIVWHFPDTRATTLPNWQYRLKLAAYRQVLQRAVNKSKSIITVSNFTKRDIVRHLKIDPKRIAVTYLGAEKMVLGTERLPNSPAFTDYLNSTFNIKKPYLLYVGSAYPHKNLEKLLEAFKLLRVKFNRNWQLVLAGRKDYFYKKLEEGAGVAMSPELAAGVIFTGQVSERDLDGLYRGARFLVFPSLYEGFGLPPLEAMARGVPVVAAKTASIPEILSDAACYFNPEDIVNMAEIMDLVGGSRQVQDELTRKGYERVKNFSWEKTVKETSAIYELIHNPV